MLPGMNSGLLFPQAVVGGVTDDLDTKLAALEAAGKLVSAWFLPTADPDRDLVLSGTNVTTWNAAYGTFKANLTVGANVSPVWDSTLYSGKGGLTFNGTSQCLTLAGGNVSSWPAASSDLYMLAAVRSDDESPRMCFAYGSGASAGRSIGVDNTTVPRIWARAATLSAFGTTDPSGSHTIGAHFDIGGTTTGYLDGVSNATVVTATAALTIARARIGAGHNTAAANFWSGAIVAAAILNATATGTDFTDLEALMRARLA